MRFLFVGILCLVCNGAFAVDGVSKHAVPTKAYVNNANNLTSGVISVERLPVGTEDGKVAAGNDVRFDTVRIGQPDEIKNIEGRALVWIE